MGLKVDESGLEWERLRGIVSAVLPEAMRKAMEEAVLPESTRLVPKLDGDLAASGKVLSGDGFAAIRYSGPYARKQHELLGFKHPHGGQAKFLETALMTETDKALGIVSDEVKKAL